jgi:hypothetical protein
LSSTSMSRTPVAPRSSLFDDCDHTVHYFVELPLGDPTEAIDDNAGISGKQLVRRIRLVRFSRPESKSAFSSCIE